MAFFSIPSNLKSIAISLTLLSTLFFFLLLPPPQLPHLPVYPSSSSLFPHRSLLDDSIDVPSPPCLPTNYTESNGVFNYFSLHFCLFQANPFYSVPFLALSVLLQFYILIKAAQDHFSVVVTKLVAHLKLSPSMGAVTLLALGNGAPDVFASVAAVRGGQARTGFGAILSAGTFVSAFVVGFVAIYAAPFAVDPASFLRDVLFYLIAAMFLFSVYLSAEIFLWQAVGFVGFYLFFVGVVFWMDLGMGGGRKGKVGGAGVKGSEAGLVEDGEFPKVEEEAHCEKAEFSDKLQEEQKRSFGVSWGLSKVSQAWELPVSIMLKLTIPETSPLKWSRFYQSANIAICPLVLLYTCNSLMPLNHPVVFLVPNTLLPLWLVVLCGSCSLATLHFLMEKEPPKNEQILVVMVAFVMSVFWISTVAGELLNCLATLGVLLRLPSALLGLTVLAWGNSVGDLVADVAVAKAGQPTLAMAGCFAGPMFNMLFGLGTALVMQTAKVYPDAYELHFHVSIVVAFVFLLLSLMGSMLIVTWHRFRVPRFWGFCLVGLYSLFISISLIIAKFSM